MNKKNYRSAHILLLGMIHNYIFFYSRCFTVIIGSACIMTFCSNDDTTNSSTISTNKIQNKQYFIKSTLASNLRHNPKIHDMSQLTNLHLDIRYATTNNFTGQNLYGNYTYCFLHVIAANKLKIASRNLQKVRPGWKLLIFDCLRPLRIQKKLWEVVRGTPQQSYVANPRFGSIHNFGFAIDLSLLDEKNQEVDMGTPYDSFQLLSQPRLESKFLKIGKISPKQLENRKILRKVMVDSGFKQLAIEWWHYDALPSTIVRKNHTLF